ncbi:MAG: hypothetical protein ACYCPQ_02530 [Elusimicrobiota bacterium]
MSLKRWTAAGGLICAGALLWLGFLLRRENVAVDLPSGDELGRLSEPPSPTSAQARSLAYTNEMQAKNLGRQKASLGIQGIIAPRRVDPARKAALLDQLAGARSPDEAASALSELSDLGRASSREAGIKPAIFLTGRTPRILSKDDGSFPAQKGSPIDGFDWVLAPRKPPGPSRVISREKDWRDFWSALVPGEPEPSVNFKSRAAALVVLAPGSSARALKLVSSARAPDARVILYRVKDSSVAAKPGGKTWLCGIKEIPKDGAPVKFEEAP